MRKVCAKMYMPKYQNSRKINIVFIIFFGKLNLLEFFGSASPLH